jgi:hypothetical protein
MEPSAALEAFADLDLPGDLRAALGPDVETYLAAAVVLRAMPLGEVPNALVAVAGGRK